jgi:hypothetical protein
MVGEGAVGNVAYCSDLGLKAGDPNGRFFELMDTDNPTNSKTLHLFLVKCLLPRDRISNDR